MRRPHRMPIQRLQHFACWPIERYGVRYWPQAVEAILPVFARRESTSEIHLWLVWILLFV